MPRVLIIGAHGQIARVVTSVLLDQTDASLMLYLRRAHRLRALATNPRIRIVEGDATHTMALASAITGQDVVYANLSGDMARQARAIVEAMKQVGVKRLIFVSSMGIYDEVPGAQYRSILDPYRDSAAIIEGSGLDYTVIRPAWLNDADVVAYGLTHKGEPFVNSGSTVSRRSVADLIARMAVDPGFGVGESFGVHYATPKKLRGMTVMIEVIVLIGAGSIGQAIARRVGAGRHVLIADLRVEAAEAAAQTFRDAGFATSTAVVDVAQRASVEALAAEAASLGTVMGMIHAAGVSPSQAPVETILRIDLYGTALVLEAFGAIIAPGGAGVVISSQSGYRMGALTADQDRLLAITPTEELLALPMLSGDAIADTLQAYQMSKRANCLRVRSESVRWGRRGARVNAISPGIVITPLANDELNGPRGEGYRRMLSLAPAGRAGTPDEIGSLGAFLMGREGAFISGSDILIDGGATASWYYGPLAPSV